MKALLTILIATAINGTATASDGKVHLARASWSAFECSALAGAKGGGAESERLFEYGHKAGLEFLAAFRQGKISTTEANRAVPVGFLFVAQGPNHDFILGRVYESAVGSVMEDLRKPVRDTIADGELILVRAANAYASKNCALVGRNQ